MLANVQTSHGNDSVVVCVRWHKEDKGRGDGRFLCWPQARAASTTSVAAWTIALPQYGTPPARLLSSTMEATATMRCAVSRELREDG
jgi:hypothetical protein